MILRSQLNVVCQKQTDAKRFRTRKSAAVPLKDMDSAKNGAAEHRVVISYCPGRNTWNVLGVRCQDYVDKVEAKSLLQICSAFDTKASFRTMKAKSLKLADAGTDAQPSTSGAISAWEGRPLEFPHPKTGTQAFMINVWMSPFFFSLFVTHVIGLLVFREQGSQQSI